MKNDVIFLRIQVLRFVAAFLVVLYHAQITVISYFPGPEPFPILEYGAYGVDLFFVISGFIIVFIGTTKEVTPALFTSRRAQRIIPLYWAVTLGAFVLTYIPGLARSESPGLIDLAKSLAFLSWTNGPETYPVLSVGWTLEFEIFFYAVAAISMAVSARPWPLAAAVLLILVLTGRGTTSFLQNPMLLEFVLGMMVAAFIYDRRLFYGLLVATTCVLVSLPWDGAAWRVWMFGVPSALIVGAAVWLDFNRPYRGLVLPKLGNASYSIYLVHVIAISFACKVIASAAPTLGSAIAIPMISFFAVCVGYIAYLVLERNILAILATWGAREPVRTDREPKPIQE